MFHHIGGSIGATSPNRNQSGAPVSNRRSATPIPVLAAPVDGPEPRPTTISRSVTAARLGIAYGSVGKLVRCSILPLPIPAALVDKLAARPDLVVVDGELTVLRTGSKEPANPGKYPEDSRAYIGFDMGHSDAELEETSLRWWRSDPEIVRDNQVLAVTVATVPVAVYRITDHVDTYTRPDENRPRHHYAGQLLGRLGADLEPRMRQDTPGDLRALARQILTSRIRTSSGGPIAYLGAVERPVVD